MTTRQKNQASKFICCAFGKIRNEMSSQYNQAGGKCGKIDGFKGIHRECEKKNVARITRQKVITCRK